MADEENLCKAIADLQANADRLCTGDGVEYADLIGWLQELKERRAVGAGEYAMELLRRQWKEE